MCESSSIPTCGIECSLLRTTTENAYILNQLGIEIIGDHNTLLPKGWRCTKRHPEIDGYVMIVSDETGKEVAYQKGYNGELVLGQFQFPTIEMDLGEDQPPAPSHPMVIESKSCSSAKRPRSSNDTRQPKRQKVESKSGQDGRTKFIHATFEIIPKPWVTEHLQKNYRDDFVFAIEDGNIYNYNIGWCGESSRDTMITFPSSLKIKNSTSPQGKRNTKHLQRIQSLIADGHTAKAFEDRNRIVLAFGRKVDEDLRFQPEFQATRERQNERQKKNIAFHEYIDRLKNKYSRDLYDSIYDAAADRPVVKTDTNRKDMEAFDEDLARFRRVVALVPELQQQWKRVEGHVFRQAIHKLTEWYSSMDIEFNHDLPL
jgi:hypothetical protein